MSKSIPAKSSNLFTVFIAVAGLAVIGVMVWLNQQPATVSETTNANNANTTAQGGGTSESETALTNVLAPAEKTSTATDTQESTQDTSNVNTTTSESAYGIGLLAPATQTSDGDIVTYQFGSGNIVNIMPPEFESLVLHETTVVRRSPATIGNQTGERIIIKSAKDGSEISIIHIVANGYLYDIRGSEDFIKSINQYISFTH